MEIPILQVDAFTSEPFKGNPAAVCLLDEPRPAEWMQNVAMEMNLAETAFVVPRGDGGFGLRWFTPAIEIELCGHATLASAHALWETGRLSMSEGARFYTLSGWLAAKRLEAQIGQIGQIEMDFPAIFSETAELPAAVWDALGLAPGGAVCSRARSPKGNGNYLLEVDSEEAVRKLNPDFGGMRRVLDTGVIITARGGSAKYDFMSRFFAPYAGIDEDPVTGSAHCLLATYWSERAGKNEMLGYQCSARGGEVQVRLNGDRVALGGSAVTVLRGSLFA